MHTFQFFRAGGIDQVHFATGADLVHLNELDHTLWAALACPTKGLSIDARTLELIDTDGDGRIRSRELSAAAAWVGAVLAPGAWDRLLAGDDGLSLASLATTGDGPRLATAARSALEVVGKKGAPLITVADAVAATRAFDARPFNGDGVVPAASAPEEATRALAGEVITCTGGSTDRSGAKGFTADQVTAFFTAVGEHAAWLAQADASVMVVGDQTSAARAALEAVRTKIDDFFARCALAAFDPRATSALNRDEKDFAAIAQGSLTMGANEIAALPLARIEGPTLPLSTSRLNPAWAARMKDFVKLVIEPLAGGVDQLTPGGWTSLQAQFAAWDAWQSRCRGALVASLGAARVTALARAEARAPLDALLALEAEQAPIASSLLEVEKLARLARDLHRLALNFVNFRDFYARGKALASFQVGTLYLDQRACELCLRVDDVAKHATMAPLARAYLAYCEVNRPASGEKMTIVAAFTAGDSDNLMVGRNGLFVDRQGRDWDATITRLVENPISVRQAFFSPYKKLLRFVEEQVAKRATDADQAATESLKTGATAVGKTAETGAAPPEPKKLDIGVVAALGVAVGGITAAMGALLQSFFGLGLYMPLGVVGLLLLISGPSMVIAWLKLRQRNIGPLLDASGWAVNANVRLNLPLGASLTHVAALPSGATLDTRDPFEERGRPWRVYVTLAVLLSLGAAWSLGRLDRWLPAPARSSSVFGTTTPAPTPAPAP